MRDTYRTPFGPANAKMGCRNINHVNLSNKVLLGISQGIGNAILTTPLIKALSSMKLKVDILDNMLIRGAEKIFRGMDNVMMVSREQAAKRNYLIGLQTMWPNASVQDFVTQIRFAPHLNDLWRSGVPAHEVDVNMSLAYSLKYEGEIPSLYCHYNEKVSHSIDRKRVGIHICRQYNHQFHANRQLKDPLELGEMLIEAGFQPVIFGHEKCVSDEDRKKHPGFEYITGIDLPDTAGYIEKIDCMVNEDSGIMHVTAAMNKPQVALFGPTHVMKNSPYSNKAIVLQRDLPCQPCQYSERANNCSKNICMDIEHRYIVQCVNDLINNGD
jgi:ADP-heptose:LPS heptosyltransferase